MDQVRVRRIDETDWRVWRGIRLAALAADPHRFGSDLATEQSYDQARWRRG